MEKLIKYIFLILILATGITANTFATIGNADTVKIKTRTPTKEQIKYYTDQKDFDYKQEDELSSKLNLSWLDRFVEWLARQFEGLFSNRPSAVVIRYIIVIVLILTIVFVLLKISPQKLFFKNKTNKSAGIDYKELSLQQSDLDEFVNRAILDKNYRNAIRFLFLKLLKKLDESALIKLGIQKTNMEYLNELRTSKYKKDFSQLSTVFEFVWYGEFCIEENIFSNIHQEFKQLYQKLDA